MARKTLKVSDYIADFLSAWQVDTVFAVAGGHLMYLMDSIVNRNNIKYVSALHEQAAAMMAKSYARAADNIGVCMVTSGPGGTNAMTGCASAWTDSTPVLFLSGQFMVETLHRDINIRGSSPQQYYPVPMVQSITKYSRLILDEHTVPEEFVKAMTAMLSGRTGPVWLDLPLDIQGKTIEADIEADIAKIKQNISDYNNSLNVNLDSSKIQEIITAIQTAKRPVILAGHGVRLSKSIPAVHEFVKKSGIPVLTTVSAIDMFDSKDTNWYGRPGNFAQRAANFIIQNSDLLIAIGAGLHYETTGFNVKAFARAAKKIIVDIDDQELKKPTVKPDIAVNADAAVFLRTMLDQQINYPNISEWRSHCDRLRSKYWPMAIPKHNEQYTSLYRFYDVLSHSARPDSCVLTGNAGFHATVGWQCWQTKFGQRHLAEVGAGCMGHTLPSAIGASFSKTTSDIICVTGDGGIQVNLQELQTALTYNVNLKLFIIENGGYLSLINTQKKYFDGRMIGSTPDSGLALPDFTKLLPAYGFKYNVVKTDMDLEFAIEENLNTPGAFVTIVHIDPDTRMNPIVQSKMVSKGRIVSLPIEELTPDLPDEKFLENMIIPRFTEWDS